MSIFLQSPQPDRDAQRLHDELAQARAYADTPVDRPVGLVARVRAALTAQWRTQSHLHQRLTDSHVPVDCTPCPRSA